MPDNTITAGDKIIISLLEATGLFGIISNLEMYNNVILAYNQDEDVRLKGVWWKE